MSDFDRYDINYTRDRTRGWDERDRDRRDDSIFGFDRSRGDHRRGRQDEDRYSEDRGGGRADRERRYGPDDDRRGLAMDETSHLIASNKVEGTAVYSRDGRRLGTIYNFMVDKISGRVEYAVMAFGGFLGLGERYYPVPWRLLSYDTRVGGYRVDMVERDLERAPSFDRRSEPRFDRRYGSRVHDYYGLDY